MVSYFGKRGEELSKISHHVIQSLRIGELVLASINVFSFHNLFLQCNEILPHIKSLKET